MLVTDRRLVPAGALPQIVAAAVRGGVDVVQVREKDLDDDALLALTQEIVAAVDAVHGVGAVGAKARIVVNGRPAVARAAGAGLHLPEADPAPSAAERRRLTSFGPSAIRVRSSAGAPRCSSTTAPATARRMP